MVGFELRVLILLVIESLRRARSSCWVRLAVFCLVLCLFVPGTLSTRDVTLKSIKLFTSHSYIPFGSSIFFSCYGEDMITLPDVTTVNSLYTFNGEESWQPLTALPPEKCKRCGVYQMDDLVTNPFDEWELCPEDFVDGQCVHFKKNELNATFSCPECDFPANFTRSSGFKDQTATTEKKHRVMVVIVIVVAIIVFFAGLAGGFMYRQKRKLEEDKAKFLRMFDEVDDMEDELGIGRII